MKQVTATEARRRWFELLDSALAGEDIVIERRGFRLKLALDSSSQTNLELQLPDYSRLLSAPDGARADLWTWTWTGPDSDLEAVEKIHAKESGTE